MTKQLLTTLVLIGGLSASYAVAQTTDIGSSTERISCSLSIDAAQSVLNPDNTADNEPLFLQLSIKALSDCRRDASQWRGMDKFIDAGADRCTEAANQGMSDLYRGTCLLKVAQAASFILGR